MPTIGRYEVEEQLGEGGMAVVYAAHDPYVRRQVAIKVLAYQWTTDELFREYFQREAEVIAALEHECIVPVFDFGWHGVQPYIVMRYMAGGSLEDQLRDTSMPLSTIAAIIGRVAEGLDAAHASDIIHRDVKPSNVLFDNDEKAYLSDFGLAKLLARTGAGDEGWLVGTPEYMSPEQVRGEEVDGRADIYGLGALLYRVLADEVAFPGETTTLRVQAHVEKPAPDLTKIRPDLQSAWGEIIRKAMAKAPEDRYATAGELAQEVQEVASGRWYLRKLVM
ncbi:MAG: protein kinase [Chloroflexi bacterium]|jgi:serine/threonine-protein kinase|nr:protein kinase [Chloroflexota bacterium]